MTFGSFLFSLYCCPFGGLGCFQNRRGPTHRARQGARLHFSLGSVSSIGFSSVSEAFSMLVPGTASSPSDVSRVLDMFSLVMVRQDRGFDPNLVDLFSCRFLRNDRDEFSVSFLASLISDKRAKLSSLALSLFRDRRVQKRQVI